MRLCISNTRPHCGLDQSSRTYNRKFSRSRPSVQPHVTGVLKYTVQVCLVDDPPNLWPDKKGRKSCAAMNKRELFSPITRLNASQFLGRGRTLATSPFSHLWDNGSSGTGSILDTKRLWRYSRSNPWSCWACRTHVHLMSWLLGFATTASIIYPMPISPTPTEEAQVDYLCAFRTFKV